MRKDISGGEKSCSKQGTESIRNGWRLGMHRADIFIEGRQPRVFGVADIWSTTIIEFELVMNQDTIVRAVESLVVRFGCPAFLLCADVPEFRANVFCAWARSKGLEVRYVTAAEVAADRRCAEVRMAFRMIQGAGGRVN